MKKMLCVLTALMMAAALAVPAGSLAGEALLNLTFDSGTGGAGTYVQGGGLRLGNENGELACHISAVGTVNYANQVQFGGFGLMAGARYTLEFDAHSTLDRAILYRIQLNGGDYRGYVDGGCGLTAEAAHVRVDFTAPETDPAPLLVFNMGVQSGMNGDPGEHTVYLDNITLTCADDSAAAQPEAKEESPAQIRVNQVGYRPADEKTAVAPEALSGTAFTVVREDDGAAVLQGEFGSAVYDAATQTKVCRGDFTALAQEGSYRLEGQNGLCSFPFRVDENVYDELLTAAARMLYLQRCGTAIPASEGDFAHPACHTGIATVYGTGEKKDVSGGWHDAGDYGRYVVPGAKTVLDLLLAWEVYGSDALKSLSIPESGSGVPDLLSEVRWELEWMLKMQDEATGGVYHKVSCASFCGTIMPQEEREELILSPISAAATGDFAAVTAKAARVWRTLDADFADRCLAASRRAWAWLNDGRSLTGYKNPDDISTGEYGDGNVKDELLLAATELVLTDRALAIEPDADALRIMESGLPRAGTGLGWGDMGAYAVIEYTLAAGDTQCTAAITSAADRLLAASASDGYFSTMGTSYYWGSNMGAANNGILLLMASRFTGSDAYRIAAKKQLDALLGVNGMNYSYVTGFGTQATSDPHHRLSQCAGHAVPGMLAGGPNPALQDNYAGTVLQGRAPALCYTDNSQSYSTNEIAIYWNSPLVFLLCGI